MRCPQRPFIVLVIGWLALPTDARQSAAGSKNVVLEWNEIATDAYDHAPDIPASWRGIPIAQVAVFEAVNAIDGRYEPYPNPQGPLMAPAGSSADAAAVAAAYQVLRTVYPKETWIDGRQSDSLKNIPDGTAKNDGIAVGKAAAARVLALRKADGWYRTVSYKAPKGPGVWRPTPPDYAAPFGMQFASVKPWTMTSASQFRPGPPPALDSAQYASELNEVKSVGARASTARTSEEALIARFWIGISVVHEWHKLARDAAAAARLDRSDAARLLALVSMAYSDAVIATFDTKFFYKQWRPVTAIREAEKDGNPATTPDTHWLPLAETTFPFPDYISAHCTVATAPLAVIKAVTGDRNIAVEGAGTVRRYASLDAFRDECILARVWAGVHTRTSSVVGIQVGTRIAQHALEGFLKPARPKSAVTSQSQGTYAARVRN
jgi:hypothetical protein